jgi:hypothetical protein
VQTALVPVLALISIVLNASNPYCLDRIHNATWVLDEPLEGVVTGYRPLIVADMPKSSWAVILSPYSNQTLQLSMERKHASNIVVLLSPIPVPLTANVTVYLVYESGSKQCRVAIFYYAQKTSRTSVEIWVPKPKHYDPLRIINESLKKLGGKSESTQERLLENATTNNSSVLKSIERHAVLSSLSDRAYFAILVVAILVLVVDYLSSPRHAS